MGIFTRLNGVTENTVTEPEVELIPAYEGYIDPSYEGLQSILFESSEEYFRLNASMFISDIVMEEAVLEGTAEPEPLMEAFVKTTWERMKQAFISLAQRIKAWYNAVLKQIDVQFSAGSKFAEKYADEIKAKTPKGYSYNAYAYDCDAGEAAVKTAMEKLDKHLSDLNLDSLAEGKASASAPTMESILSNLGGKNKAEVLAAIRKAYRGGDEKRDIEAFSATSKDDMLECVKSSRDVIANLRSHIDRFEKDTSSIVANINKAISQFSKGDGADTAEAVKHLNLAKEILALKSQIMAIEIESVKEVTRSHQNTLKSFLRWNPKNSKDDSSTAVVTKESTMDAASILGAVNDYL